MVTRVSWPGIIPARAGFTRSAFHTVNRQKDHPRSRGVYDKRAGRGIEIQGSSPLARGLPQTVPKLTDRSGIIPARAGFTAQWEYYDVNATDHPRSRGVYRLRTKMREIMPWIIPARAGFTAPAIPPRSIPWDHPRSRGVYPRTSIIPIWIRGSSPLARGLPVYGRDRNPKVGIIPARAGFTGASVGVVENQVDHPRSRGVYGAGLISWWLIGGSSPLARGLQDR